MSQKTNNHLRFQLGNMDRFLKKSRERIAALEAALQPFKLIADATDLACKKEGAEPGSMSAVCCCNYLDCKIAQELLDLPQ